VADRDAGAARSVDVRLEHPEPAHRRRLIPPRTLPLRSFAAPHVLRETRQPGEWDCACGCL